MKIVLALRAAISFAVGIFITFTQSHSAVTGLLALAIFGIGYSVLNGIGTGMWGKGLTAVENMPLTVAAFIIGLLAVLVPATDPEAQQLAFIYLVTGWGLISGSFELYLARREGFATSMGKDSLLNAGFGLLLGVLFLIAPLDIVSAVGFFGAYLVLSGTHLAIAAATPKK
ncbi:unannotated protein [freshwater metagenome]|uniref:Unannotated protein n=1 Tax=freshwater metagenome TaxID=449393 RepID=A0A6J6JIQ0_9ZZZZ|nr:hypothetical protein [Actinomycetota bacterium]